MSHVPLSFPCQYCGQNFKTSKGRSNHLSQFKKCQTQLMEASKKLQARKRTREDIGSQCSDADSQKSGNIDDDNSGMMDFDPSTPEYAPQDDSLTGNGSDEPVRKRNKVTIEEVPDIDSQGPGDNFGEDYVEDFPWSAGEPTGKTKRTPFEKISRDQRKAGKEAWGSFKDEEEWDLARWLMTSSISQTRMNEFMSLPIVRTTKHEHRTCLTVTPSK